MLAIRSGLRDKGVIADADALSALPPGAVWLDLLSGTPAETSFVARMTGVRVPTLADLSEIESSSRLRAEKAALYLSASIVFRAASGIPMTTPVGFVLTPERFVTIRFENLEVFDALKGKEDNAPSLTSAGAFVALIEAIVDRMADTLEQVEVELKAVSERIFREEDPKRTRRPARVDANLREVMRRVGRGGDLASDIRDSLLGIGRIVPYVTRLGADWLPEEVRPRLETLRADIDSLDDYQTHLANKVQLLLDATLGLINIEQNNIIKVLTIVSVVGAPPTLVASMYGMNFKHMPEYDWAWGYPYGLALIAVSAIAPLLWFKLRGWL